MAGKMVFDTVTKRQLPVTIDGVDYVLREANSDVGARYKTACIRGAKFQEGKPTTVDNLGDVEPLLVAGCLFKVTPTGEEKVTEAWVRTLPNRVVKPMFDWAKENSDLNNQVDTVESLNKDIAKLQEKLARLIEEKAEGN